ncbi:TlpA family protein disulfide reductase [Candidatus Pelagibacter sp.]|jgi:thiol-disulfide isomerase/thioredoxin|nr:TlpA family protein disulfide reductase [Candidatus Pelagibacter bacterium]MDA9177176.1 TlpA family protein disulfide reductase [Candidatus Pelagibacter sp.]NDH70026.1 TlpA family protein disulfide reductase [Pseudomonadota bacterium]MDA9562246.1 TlpA family protein disulfide reductase [Candidatus Pelagibacter bacterium]MDB3931960.1 TlpA family protein disulfide reductase [Candidatus Pelagibacter sp.]
MRFLVIFIFLISHAIADDFPKIKNLVLNKDFKAYENITFLDADKKIVNLSDYKENLVLLNFWATWCAPCKEEMPSLDGLKLMPELNNIEIFPINIGKDSLKKSDQFFKDLNIKNLNIYFDNPKTLAKDFGLRGVPTTILFNKEGKEFARVIGSIDFLDKEFIEWIKNYN